ncbi:MAG: hypothetical protein SOX83_01780, partial [Sodaliphilus sp.]|nr:hypothetical protein [Sodaliphilus sp.]
LSPLSPTVGCFAPHSHPSPPEEKAASRKKSRLRRKKTAPVGVGVGGCVGEGIEGRAQNIAPLQVGESTHRPASPYTAVRQTIGAVFFRRSRLFLREAAFFSGGEGCEWGAKQPTVCSEWG